MEKNEEALLSEKSLSVPSCPRGSPSQMLLPSDPDCPPLRPPIPHCPLPSLPVSHRACGHPSSWVSTHTHSHTHKSQEHNGPRVLRGPGPGSPQASAPCVPPSLTSHQLPPLSLVLRLWAFLARALSFSLLSFSLSTFFFFKEKQQQQQKDNGKQTRKPSCA